MEGVNLTTEGFFAVFESFIVQPIFNLLVFIHALVPGGNFGISIIIFTFVIRFLMWPLVRKQLHQSRAMRGLQPEIKKIKKSAKGDRQKESALLMELYKERGINPFSSFGTLIIQFVILIGLFRGLQRVIEDSSELVNFAYAWIQNLPLMQRIAENPDLFDNTLLGVVDLSRAAISPEGLYIPAMILVIGSAVTQFFQSSQLMPKDEDAKTLKQILQDAKQGKQADPSEANAAVGRSMRYFIPVIIFFVTVFFASALSLYWFMSGLIGYWQQSRILAEDTVEMQQIGDKPNGNKKQPVIEGEVVDEKKQATPKKKSKKTSAKKGKKSSKKSAKKRRK